MATLRAVTVDNEGGRQGWWAYTETTTDPHPLRYCGQIIVDKSIGVNVVLSISSKFPLKRYSADRVSLLFPPERYSCKRRSLVFTVLACWVYAVVFLLID